MMVRTQITLDSELQVQARQRASELGVSLAEYVRRLVARDVTRPELEQKPDISCIFNLGSSDGQDIAGNKDAMIAEAYASFHKKSLR